MSKFDDLIATEKMFNKKTFLTRIVQNALIHLKIA